MSNSHEARTHGDNRSYYHLYQSHCLALPSCQMCNPNFDLNPDSCTHIQTMGLIHNGAGTQQNWYTKLGHSGTGMQRGWYTMGLVHNGTSTQRTKLSYCIPPSSPPSPQCLPPPTSSQSLLNHVVSVNVLSISEEDYTDYRNWKSQRTGKLWMGGQRSAPLIWFPCSLVDLHSARQQLIGCCCAGCLVAAVCRWVGSVTVTCGSW